MKKILYLLALLTIATTSCKKFTYNNKIERVWQRVDAWGNDMWHFKDGYVVKAFTPDTLFTYEIADKETIIFNGYGYDYTDIATLHKLTKDSLVIQFQGTQKSTRWAWTGEK